MPKRQSQGRGCDDEIPEKDLEIRGIEQDYGEEHERCDKRGIKQFPAREDPECDHYLDRAECVEHHEIRHVAVHEPREIAYPGIGVQESVERRIQESECDADSQEKFRSFFSPKHTTEPLPNHGQRRWRDCGSPTYRSFER